MSDLEVGSITYIGAAKIQGASNQGAVADDFEGSTLDGRVSSQQVDIQYSIECGSVIDRVAVEYTIAYDPH